ncbi:alpha/beta fold hydrolase [Rhizobacter sp. Root404]|uniref:alpha/beta fold hydrolase n=1 Tax=Rhizobacter sp. Root404 TaxID=1736528 RepID=UPI0009EB964D|nr:alpha/beta hydrolase [Rhizobacter sp. Root404]
MRAARPAVVLLHSSAASSRQWDALAACLRPAFDVHAVDLHGHGRQAPWRGDAPLSVQAEASLVLPLLERAGSAHVIGHSYGAAVALHLAVAQPSLVRSLAVFEPVLFGLLAEHEPLGSAAREAFDLAAQLHALVAGGRVETAAEQFVDYWSGPTAWKRLAPTAQQSVAGRMPIVVQHFDALFREALTPPELTRLTMPVLCMAGDRSTAAALRIAGVLRRLLPDASHDLLAGVGHLGPITHAALINQRLLRFLETSIPSAHLSRPAVRPDISSTLQMEQSA